MSETFEPIPPEDEALPVGTILLSAGAAVLIFAVAILIAWWMSLAGATGAAPAGTPDVGMVHQRPFALEKTAAQLKVEQSRKLSQYGWVDRERQLIHLPIDRAVEQLLAGQQREAKR